MNEYSLIKHRMNLYPIEFIPILKEVIWGGTMLKDIYGKKTESDKIGESWELSGLPNNVSVVNNGEYAGLSLYDVIELNPHAILGNKNIQRSGMNFPLLIKLIDACDDLSIQVHPNDEQAQPLGSAGKTEMWYVLSAKPDTALISGMTKPLTQAEYVERVGNGTIADVLQKHMVRRGDVFFIPAGRIHAIGRGIMLLEIQQSSNITYRIFDYNRRDANGKQRELHTEQAKNIINYNDCLPTKTLYKRQINMPFNIAQCPYFTANIIDMDGHVSICRDYNENDSFEILTCTKGSASIRCNANASYNIVAGKTMLIPAAIPHITIIPNGEAEIVEIYT
jgi:mannose-6-phosphate isomerase